MLKRHLSGLLVLALVFTFAGISGHARTRADLENELSISALAGQYDRFAEPEMERHAKLRADMDKLVADARAGKVTPAARTQIQPAKSNSLSKKAKVAIGVGIAVIVLAIIIKHEKDNFFNCKSRCVI